MTDLKIRKLPFKFDDVAFIWNPANPFFSIAMNKFSLFAIGFEKYICRAIAEAEKLISDPEVLAEANAFRQQEAIHSVAHQKHVRALVATYPGVQPVLDMVIQSYDDLFESRDLKYHLAYIGGLESTFTPTMKSLIDNRELLLAGGDARVASLLLWHFCEEIEHRSSGLMIYDHLFGNYLFRAKAFPGAMRHVMGLFAMMDDEFKARIPEVPHGLYAKKTAKPIPRIDGLKAAYGVIMSQMPWHDPEHQIVPGYFYEWYDRFDAGEDMTQIYGVRHEPAMAVAAE